MARRREPQQIGNLVNRWFVDKGIDKKIDESRIIETWAEMAGVDVNSVTRSVYIKDNRLFVQIASSTWRQKLFTQRAQLLEELNSRVGNDKIKAINFR